MDNPIAGQTYTQTFTNCGDLSAATVKILYLHPNGKQYEADADTVDTVNSTITWIMTPSLTQVGGLFKIKAKVTIGEVVKISSNDAIVEFDPVFEREY